MGGVISLYKQPLHSNLKCLALWCTLSHRLFPKAMDSQPEKYSIQRIASCKIEMQLIRQCSKLELHEAHVPRANINVKWTDNTNAHVAV